MEKMNNVIIDRAERGKSGEASWGKWQAWSVWFVGMEPKFDYFETDTVVPFPGMQIDLAEYTVVQNGQYTNYKLKKLVPVQLAGSPVLVDPPVQVHKLSPVAPVVVDYEKEKRLTMCTSYAKDLMVQLIAGGSYPTMLLSPIIDLVAKGGKLLAKRLGEKVDVVPEPEVIIHSSKLVEFTPTIPEPPALIPEMVVSPEMAEAVNEVLVTPVVLPIPEKDIPNDNIPF